MLSISRPKAASVPSFQPNSAPPSVFSVFSVPLWLKFKPIRSDSPGSGSRAGAKAEPGHRWYQGPRMVQLVADQVVSGMFNRQPVHRASMKNRSLNLFR